MKLNPLVVVMSLLVAVVVVLGSVQLWSDEDEATEEVMPEMVPEAASSDPVMNTEGVHIMADGMVMAGNGTPLPKAEILADGTIRLPDGQLVTPAFDLRQ